MFKTIKMQAKFVSQASQSRYSFTFYFDATDSYYLKFNLETFFFFWVSLIYFYKFLLFRPGASALFFAELSRVLSLLGALVIEQKTQLYSWKLPYKAFYTAYILCGFVKYKNLLAPLEMLNFEKYSSLACLLLFMHHIFYPLTIYC